MRLDLTGSRPRLDLGDPSLRLTDAQRSACAHDREIAVTAGAGTGKTYTLSLRYVVLLLDVAVNAVLAAPHRPRPNVESVLVLTFTEKAAQEMADRCYRRLLSLADAVRGERQRIDERYGSGFGASLAASVDHLLDTSGLAAISTFHGFAARVLREFPSETGTVPGFEVSEEADAAVMLAEEVEAAVEALAQQQPGDLAVLLDSFRSRPPLIDAVATLVRDRSRLEPRLSAWADGSLGVDTWLATQQPSVEAIRRWLRGEARPCIDELGALLAPGGSDFALEVLPALQRRLSDLPDDPLACNQLYVEVLGALSPKGDKIRSLSHHSVLGTKAAWPAGQYAPAKVRSNELAEEMAPWIGLVDGAKCLPGRYDPLLAAMLPRLARLVATATDRLIARLDSEGVVDFTALQLRAVAAVVHTPELRRRLCARYRYLMVDEFQDTDAVQWSMVRALGRPDDAPSDRIFFVGDVKQAIYGFRGGDVTVFDSAAAELDVSPVVLGHNFRSRENLIGWFNACFSTVLPRCEPMEPARGVAGGSVVLLTHEGGVVAETAAAEADAVGRLLAAEVLPSRGLYGDLDLLDTNAHPTPPVAILLQRRTHQGVFEQALRRHGVPFVVAKGIGFWSRPEILDLVNTLHSLATGDPISRTGALRSPLFGVPDDEIFQGSGPTLQRAAHRLAALTQLRDRVPVSTLLRTIASEGRGWHTWALGDPHGQAAANVERLISLAAGFDSRGPEGLETVAEFFLSRVLGEERESEAAITPTAARVVLMTVHASKGLEFPVVVLPLLGQPPRSRPSSLVIARDGEDWDVACNVLGLPAEPPTGAARPIRTPMSPGRRHWLAASKTSEERAEDRRLFYVAATRARDHLILLGDTAKGGSRSGSWLALLGEHHGDDLAPTDGLTVRALDEVARLTPLDLVHAAALPAPPADAASRIAPIPAPVEIEVSPSSLDLLAGCPARWLRRQVLQIPEKALRGVQRSKSLAGVRGTVIHSMLEDDVADELILAKRRWSALARSEGASQDEIDRGFDVLVDHLRLASSDPALETVLAASGYAELSFRLPLGAVVVRGQIDRLYLDATTGEWVVLDYKSERVEGDPVVAASTHRSQLLAYAWAASEVLAAHGVAPVRRAEIYYTGTGAFARLPPFTDADLDGFRALLVQADHTASRSWSEVEHLAVSSDEQRPCAQCGYRERGCRGQVQSPGESI